MSFIRKFKALFHADWCDKCYQEMDLEKKKLFMLPMMVGHYRSHNDAKYYLENLYFVKKKAEIPTGYYACGIKKYHCSHCHNDVVELDIFLPVRDQERYEETLFFKDGELDSLLKD